MIAGKTDFNSVIYMEDDLEIVQHQCKFCDAPLSMTPDRKERGFAFFQCRRCGASNVLKEKTPT